MYIDLQLHCHLNNKKATIVAISNNKKRQQQLQYQFSYLHFTIFYVCGEKREDFSKCGRKSQCRKFAGKVIKCGVGNYVNFPTAHQLS
jgi:hypothetical protein